MTEQDIIQALISRDEYVTRQFFFRTCRPLFSSIIRNVFSYDVDYDEFVNEFYLHLMENDAYRLKQFRGRSSIYQWLKVIAIRYFIAKRDSMIDMESEDTLLERAAKDRPVDEEKENSARIDIEQLLSSMQNRRYVYVLQRLVLQDAEPKTVAEELRIRIDNLYNIKKRAIAALTELVLKEIGKYEKETCK